MSIAERAIENALADATLGHVAVERAVELLEFIANDPLMRGSYRVKARRWLAELAQGEGAE